MHLTTQIEIDDELWSFVKTNYEASNFQAAILDSIYFISKDIRDKTDLDLDGVSLVGKALGGESPILKINSLLTENDKNEQKGIEAILRGVFQGIRNPRAHGKKEDNKETCDSIFIIINFIYSHIKNSKGKFDINSFTDFVLDKDYVESQEYTDLIISQIPEIKLFDTLTHIISNRKNLKPNIFYLIINSFREKLNNIQLEEMDKVFSQILQKTAEDSDIRLITSAYKEENWTRIEHAARLRIENKLLKSFEEGYFDATKVAIKSGILGTWLTNVIPKMNMKTKYNLLLTKKLGSNSYNEVEYIFRYFGNYIIIDDEEPSNYLINTINNGLKKGDARFYNFIQFYFSYDPPAWTEKINEAYTNFKEVKLQPEYDYEDDDDIPF